MFVADVDVFRQERRVRHRQRAALVVDNEVHVLAELGTCRCNANRAGNEAGVRTQIVELLGRAAERAADAIDVELRVEPRVLLFFGVQPVKDIDFPELLTILRRGDSGIDKVVDPPTERLEEWKDQQAPVGFDRESGQVVEKVVGALRSILVQPVESEKLNHRLRLPDAWKFGLRGLSRRLKLDLKLEVGGIDSATPKRVYVSQFQIPCCRIERGIGIKIGLARLVRPEHLLHQALVVAEPVR